VHDEPTPDHPTESATPAAPAGPGPSSEPESGSKWSWWWIFPAILAAYVAYSSLHYLPFAPFKPKATADDLLTQSLAAAQSGSYPECITAAKEAIKIAPSPEAYNNIGWCAARMGDWNVGIENTSQALKLKPDMERARNNLIWMLSQRDGKAPAPTATPVAQNLSPADAAMQRSLAHAQARRYQECIDAAREALKLNPTYAEAYNNLGYCSGGLGKWDEGVHYLNEALRIRPDFPLAKGNLSWIQTERAKTAPPK
jgi:tetratricopeptide (TPR) repeat protein